MEYEVKGSRPRRRPKRTWREVVGKDCEACKLNKEDAMDRNKWRKLIKDVRWSGWGGVSGWMFLLVPAYLGCPGSKAVKQLCVCVRACVCVTSVRWQVTLCDPIWYMSSHSGVAMLHCKLLYPYTFCFTFYLDWIEEENGANGLMYVLRTKWLLKQINTKNCSLSIVLTATDQKPQKSLKRWYCPPSHCLNVNVMLSKR